MNSIFQKLAVELLAPQKGFQVGGVRAVKGLVGWSVYKEINWRVVL